MKRPLAILSEVLFAAMLCLSMGAAQAEDATFSEAELDQMIAPIALYPDSLLAQILMATTYPANELNRYNIGDRTEGLKYGDDGSLTIYLQADRPAEDKVSNWLPAPKGAFTLAMRAYWPEEPILNKSYQWPPVQRVE